MWVKFLHYGVKNSNLNYFKSLQKMGVLYENDNFEAEIKVLAMNECCVKISFEIHHEIRK